MTEDRKMRCRLSKGNNSSITNYTLAKLQVRINTMVIYTQHHFHQIQSNAYKDMAKRNNH